MNRTLTAALALVAAVIPALPGIAADTKVEVSSSAQCSKMSCSAGPKFNITDSQLEQLNTIKSQFQATNGPKFAQLRTLRHELFDNLSKPAVDRNSVLALQSQINGLQADLSNARVNMMLEKSSVFTPEQRQQMRHRFLTRGAMGGHKRGFGRGGHHHGGSMSGRKPA